MLLLRSSKFLLTSIRINPTSARSFLSECPGQVMVCGPRDCRYAQIAQSFTETRDLKTQGYTPDSFVAFSIDFSSESRLFFPNPKPPKTPEGKAMTLAKNLLQRQPNGSYSEFDLCPAAITTVIEENRKRIINKQAIIPIIFVLEFIRSSGFQSSFVVSERFSDRLTTAELMRIYSYTQVSDQALQCAAEKTVHFARVTEGPQDDLLHFSRKEAPWRTEEESVWNSFVTAYKISQKCPNLLWWKNSPPK